MKDLVPQEVVEKKIYLIRGQKVMLDNDLAALYGVTTFNLNKAIKRNIERFPEDFMFQLSPQEFESLIFHFGISKQGRGGRRYLPYVFTEQGVAMLSSVLRSRRAIQVNIAIMRAFVRLKGILSANKELAYKLSELEKKIEQHDSGIQVIFDAIRKLMAQSEKPKRQIGFHSG